MGLLDTLWAAFSWRHDRTAHVTVDVRFAVVQPTSEPVVAITAVSRTEHPIRVTSVAIAADSLPGKTAWDANPHALSTLPGVIPPHDSRVAYMSVIGLEQSGINLQQPIRGGVSLSTNDMVWSEKRTLVGS
jgi:hypothetical protein